MTQFFHNVNMIGGVVMTAVAAVFGQYWFLFAGFLLFNVVDWLSGWARSRQKKESSSKAGAKGIVKKVWYWVVIGTAFFIGFSFEQMGQSIGVPLDFMNLVGWFVLANYLVNEIRSVLENLVDMDVPVPVFLVRGLKIAAEKIEAAAQIGGEDNEQQDGSKNRTG